MENRRQQGFTLYELLITLVVVSIVLSFGIPNLRSFTQNSRMTSAANDLLGTFQTARSEAARSKQNVSICASANSMSATPACGGEFEDGWILFVDPNGDAVFDAGEVLLRGYPAMGRDIDVTAAGQGHYFSYGANGLGREQTVIGQALPPTTSAVLCDDRGNVQASSNVSAARALRVLPIGRATVLRTVAQVNDQGGCP
jgi:prepilin-type N-terminal cleavage/methylation domain-containing protein